MLVAASIGQPPTQDAKPTVISQPLPAAKSAVSSVTLGGTRSAAPSQAFVSAILAGGAAPSTAEAPLVAVDANTLTPGAASSDDEPNVTNVTKASLASGLDPILHRSVQNVIEYRLLYQAPPLPLWRLQIEPQSRNVLTIYTASVCVGVLLVKRAPLSVAFYQA